MATYSSKEKAMEVHRAIMANKTRSKGKGKGMGKGGGKGPIGKPNKSFTKGVGG